MYIVANFTFVFEWLCFKNRIIKNLRNENMDIAFFVSSVITVSAQTIPLNEQTLYASKVNMMFTSLDGKKSSKNCQGLYCERT